MLYLVHKEALKLEKIIIFDVITRRYGGPHYLGALLKQESGMVKARRFDEHLEYVYRHMDEAFASFNALAKSILELKMDPLTLSKNKNNIHYLQDDKIVRCASRAKLLNDDTFKLDFICSKIESKLFYLKTDENKETSYM